MLGEKHSLTAEFPNLREEIAQLTQADKQFARDNDEYNRLDGEIRALELSNVPIEDTAMSRLKHERSVLKDSLYKRLSDASHSL